MAVSKTAKTTPADLAHVTQEMYKKNLELNERNKTLALLRQIDEIVLGAVTDPQEVGKQVAETVVAETDFNLVAVYLTTKSHSLAPLALSYADVSGELDPKIKELLLAKPIPLAGSLWEKALRGKKVEAASDLVALLDHSFHPDVTKKIQAVIAVKALFICPLEVRGEVIGVMALGTAKAAGELSSYQTNLVDRLRGVIGIAIDNAILYQEIQETSARLKEANKHLKELDKAKDDFISMASHQLRTPLTTIKGYLSMLLEGDAGKITDQQKDFIHQAFSGSERMVHLISDLLNVSRLQAGKFLIELAPTDLAAVVEDEVKQLHNHAATKNLQLKFVPPKTPLPKVSIDEGKTRQVIMNFIDNAIYYTPKGGVTVSITGELDKVVVKVADTGIGVPKSARSQLFTKFFRADNAKNERPDGTGLGLFLAKKVIEDQGGKIIFESEEGKGSTFGFELPLTAESEKPKAKGVRTK